jgi:hypothetical protein
MVTKMATMPHEADEVKDDGVCPCCGRSKETYSPLSLKEILLNTLAALLLGAVLVPLGVFVWNWSAQVLSDRADRPIFARPLEDWTQR